MKKWIKSIIVVFVFFYMPLSMAALSLFSADRQQQATIKTPEKPPVAVAVEKIDIPIKSIVGMSRFGKNYRVSFLTKEGKILKSKFPFSQQGELSYKDKKIVIVKVEKKKIALRGDEPIWKCTESKQVKCLSKGNFEVYLAANTQSSQRAQQAKTPKPMPIQQKKKPTAAQLAAEKAAGLERQRRYERDKEALRQLQKKALSIAIRDPKLLKDIPPGYKLHKSPFGDYLLPEK